MLIRMSVAGKADHFFPVKTCMRTVGVRGKALEKDCAPLNTECC